jgi:hypothetical protein
VWLWSLGVQVLEITWGKLVKDLKAAHGLSDLIAAHDRYLARLMQKVPTLGSHPPLPRPVNPIRSHLRLACLPLLLLSLPSDAPDDVPDSLDDIADGGGGGAAAAGFGAACAQELMSERTKVVVAPLMTLLDLALRFARMQEQLYARALAEVKKLEAFRRAAEAR